MIPPSAEQVRIEQAARREVHWRRWGPYLSERQWGTVREDYSPHGTAWDYLPHDHARSRAYRWGEDGIGGICDNHQRLCLAVTLWNGRDPILKERLFGLAGPEGNHGEDVKEYYFYLDSTPTHSYMRFLYKYPQAAYPYAELVEENRRRGRSQPEFELLDTGVFADDRYFDVGVEYAKATPDDVLVRLTVVNRGPEEATLHLLPTLWYRNTWSWTHVARRPRLRAGAGGGGFATIEAEHETLGRRWLHAAGAPELLFTENETNLARFPTRNVERPYVKDAFHEYLIHGRREAVNPQRVGTKIAAHYTLALAAGGKATVDLRLRDGPQTDGPFGGEFDRVLERRIAEADEFYAGVIPATLDPDARSVCRQAFAGLLWSKQFYCYDVQTWLRGDPAEPTSPVERAHGRNSDWTHLYNEDVLSMPDKWEYPWYAAWDLAFHCVALALVDPDFAKRQLKLLLREWYMHPNGQIPAYEWALGDVNPPVHAWASWRVYKIEQRLNGRHDAVFLEKIFHKLLLNFTWWVNRKDLNGNNIFQGGFLGLDNIGVFDRSAELPTGGFIEQSDGTSWMGMYCLNLLEIAMELGRLNPSYEDVASKFFEHFMYIAHAMNTLGLWDEEDGFFYDVLRLPNGSVQPLRVRSMVGLIPLFAVGTVGEEDLEKLPRFRARLLWFMRNRPDLSETVAKMNPLGARRRRMLSILNAERLRRVLKVMLDETEFLSPYGIRALSHYHRNHPYVLALDGAEHRVQYEPAESMTGIFGGNSNWRGPIWFPLNFLIIESLQKYHYYYGDDFRVEFPTGSGSMLTLWEVAREISKRLESIFLRDAQGRRPVYGGSEKFQSDPHWRDHVLFYEYFHGDNGAGIGASHQTGWTALVAKLLLQTAGHLR
ncbi:MAG: glucosidase [Deltaproteobacteria bacterium]|nr:glucosidase [Deltaproteobacteria bacterium]